jgi:isocitrate dehydrogenase kinase/phosphatase
MNDLKRELRHHSEVFKTSVGERGTVAMGFSAPSSVYTLKVIRDHPTSRYKWGKFEGGRVGTKKYRHVHEITRADLMPENVVCYDISLEVAHFEQHLLDYLFLKAGESISLVDEFVKFKHLIVKVKMIPLPVFSETASRAAAERVIINLGHCIKNNAAALSSIRISMRETMASHAIARPIYSITTRSSH